MWESCRWSAGFLGDLPFPALAFRRCFLPHFTLIGSQDLVLRAAQISPLIMDILHDAIEVEIVRVLQKHGPRMKCCACKIIAHAACIGVLMDKVKFACKPTFRDVGVRQYREQTCIHHHWVHRRTQKGKCKQCGKSFQSKLSFSSKEIVALGCSWCKMAYHNKETCFNLQKIGEECSLGNHSDIIVPPSWIVKLPRQGSFKSSLRKSPKKKTATKKKSKEKTDRDPKTFVIKPIPTTTMKPVLVFINPKSGGNQGAKLMQKFQWLLNPRQVFDLTQGGPRMGLELFRKAPNLRVLACGGDGTVGWVLSILDQISICPAPPVGVLPLGTGNDLARALGWGGGYTDEPISKILLNTAESEVTMLDRWELKVEKNPDAEPNEDGKDNLPLNVVNNYFSLGVDAHIALEFHEARVPDVSPNSLPHHVPLLFVQTEIVTFYLKCFMTLYVFHQSAYDNQFYVFLQNRQIWRHNHHTLYKTKLDDIQGFAVSVVNSTEYCLLKFFPSGEPLQLSCNMQKSMKHTKSVVKSSPHWSVGKSLYFSNSVNYTWQELAKPKTE
ncbi:hypothetical protein PR048_019821 [Dryococelus australis]|uniref:diacylglycerol kinase (ATP) n=1 Tax=Dryococelus australis TaxID=614101 RepID=A0ABQ9H4J8_9NEOP|nr:hypothetical protein PR048_019821 [Dryococelus australis]